jgi:hypothetical protein
MIAMELVGADADANELADGAHSPPRPPNGIHEKFGSEWAEI